MKDRYEFYVAYSESSNKKFRIDDKFQTIERNPHLTKGDGRDCRESVIRTLYDLIIADDKPTLKPQIVYVKISNGIHGEKFSVSKQRLVEKFAAFVNSDESYPFHLSVENSQGLIALNVFNRRGHYSTDLATMSFYFWILREDVILDWCVKVIEDNILTINALFRRLSENFLVFKDWGNYSNENLAMSFYAYTVASSAISNNSNPRSRGPVEFAQTNFGEDVLRNYVREIIMPHLTAEKKKFDVYDALVDVFPVHGSYLISDFKMLLKRLILEETKEKRVKRST